jgi:predicted metal-dependent hydrolase/DNA-binding Xre family transcriptional regulator/Zn-dependent peptidase ImmA (M78 family)
MRIVISGIPIDIQKKNIKNMHLQIKPPDGHVVISAPSSMDDKAIEVYARTNLSWIKKQIEKFQQQPRSAKRQYVSGETMYIWGKQYYLSFVPDSQKNSFEIQGDKVSLSMREDSTVKQRENYVREQYRQFLKVEIERLLPKWEKITELHCESWQTRYMVTRWGTCNTEKKKLWFNLQLVQKPIECLEYVILHELIHLRERTHNSTFIAYMDMYMKNWRAVRKELNDSKLDYYEAQDESPLQKLIDKKRYDEIKDVVLDYMSAKVKEKKATLSDIEIQNVVHIEQVDDGAISFSVIVSCDIEHSVSSTGKVSFTEKWIDVKCKVLLGVELTDFEIMHIKECEQQEDSDSDKYSGELVPIISRDAFENEATEFLEKYYPLALQEPVSVPIRRIAEDMGLSIMEESLLSSELDVFGLVVFEDGNIKDKNKNIVIRNAKRGTVLIDPRVYYERTLGTVNFTIAHECFHWHRHQPYHALMKMLGANDELGKIIQCSIGSNSKDSEKWKAIDWMEWQANGVAPHILMPTSTAKIKVTELIEKYQIHFDGADGYRIEEMISELADFYGLSKQAVKMRIREMGYAKIDGAFTYVNGQYVTPFSFDASALSDNQSFTISSADLFKAYCLNKEFRKAIDTGRFVYIEGHVCLDNEKYIVRPDGQIKLTQYALSHIDECCFVFDKGYSYESKYQGQKYYTQMMYKTPEQPNAQEYSFELNAHNKILLSQIQGASKSANAMRLYPGAFSETLVQLMKERKLSNKKLADASLVGERTIQRLRNDEEYPTTVQTVLGLCYGLKLSVPEAEMLVGKTDFNIKPTNPQNYAYRCALSACAENSIYEINEMLESCGYIPFGSSNLE